MSGGAFERVMGNMTNSSGNFNPSFGGFATDPDSKYYDSYAYGTSYTDHARGKLGDATKETLKTFGNETGGWYGNYAQLPSSNNSWIMRGGYPSDPSSAGVFYFHGNNGIAYYTHTSRAVLADIGA